MAHPAVRARRNPVMGDGNYKKTLRSTLPLDKSLLRIN